jgi:hypothetical protein
MNGVIVQNRFKILAGIPRYVLEDTKYAQTALFKDDCIKEINMYLKKINQV